MDYIEQSYKINKINAKMTGHQCILGMTKVKNYISIVMCDRILLIYSLINIFMLLQLFKA